MKQPAGLDLRLSIPANDFCKAQSLRALLSRSEQAWHGRELLTELLTTPKELALAESSSSSPPTAWYTMILLG